jgi:hypothetical protein
MSFKTSQTASKRSSRMNVPHGLKSTSFRPHPKLGSDFFVEDPALLVWDRTFDFSLFVAHYLIVTFFLSRFVFPAPRESVCILDM